MPQYFGTNFEQSKFSGLDGKTTVAFKQERKTTGEPFVVSVTPQGLHIKGDMDGLVVTEADLQDLARLITDAWKEHRKIAPKLTTSLTGH